MKNECSIVKDLLPLYIDGAVSEDSRRLVEEHTAVCEDCSKERREMMLALPDSQERQVEQNVLKRAAKKLRRKHMLRGGLLTIVSLLLGVMLVLGWQGLHWFLWEDSCVPLALDCYDVRMSALQDGRVILSYLWHAPGSGWGARYEDAEDGDGLVMVIQLQTTRLPRSQRREGYQRVTVDDWLILRDGKMMQPNGRQVVTIVREGPEGNREILYQYGVDESLVAPASAELEEYFALEDEGQVYAVLVHGYSRLADYIDREKLPFQDIDDQEAIREQMAEVSRRRQELAYVIPEWQ